MQCDGTALGESQSEVKREVRQRSGQRSFDQSEKGSNCGHFLAGSKIMSSCAVSGVPSRPSKSPLLRRYSQRRHERPPLADTRSDSSLTALSTMLAMQEMLVSKSSLPARSEDKREKEHHRYLHNQQHLHRHSGAMRAETILSAESLPRHEDSMNLKVQSHRPFCC